MKFVLEGRVLKSVSRSFYLTIRALPRGLRDPIGLAYLLARTSDTIADSTNALAAVRLAHLQAFRDMLGSGSSEEKLRALRDEIHPADPAEARLIALAGDCLNALEQSGEADRREIARVMETIIRGQELDLLRFGDGTRPVALASAADLDDYTYLVAGCVGEFWTRICFQHLRRYAHAEPGLMENLGRSFGQGLQLVNVLRDLPADLRAGRCYLPADELAALGITGENVLQFPELTQSVIEGWILRAENHLADAQRYIEAVRSPRLRFACLLPWAMGLETLALLRRNPPLTTPHRIKISRGEVRAIARRAVWAAFSNRRLAQMAGRYFARK